MSISVDDVKRIAHVARLAVTEEEAETFAQQLQPIFTHLQQIQHITTKQSLASCTATLRDDVPDEPLHIEETMRNVPDSYEQQVRVPAVFD